MSIIFHIICQLALTFLASAQSNWRTGRATFYGNEFWAWDIHKGSCGYSYLCPEEGTGWDIAALPDMHPDYSNSCARCYEIKCMPSEFQDNYNQKLSRTGVCYDPEASIVVTVTDTCPCNYAANYYSNKRWCCGDMDHLDISVWAFEKLAELRWGVIGLKYRQVSCDHKPDKVAPEPAHPFSATPVIEGTTCPKYRFPLKDDWIQVHLKYRERIQAAGYVPFESPGVVKFHLAMKSGEFFNREVEEYIFGDVYENGWSVSTKNARYYESNLYGLDGGNAMCSVFYLNSGITFSSNKGVLNGKAAIEFWVLTRGWGVPRLDLGFGGPQGMCGLIRLTELTPAEQKGGYTKFVIDLNTFNGQENEDITTRMMNAYGTRFHSCGYRQASQMNFISFQNNMHFEQTVCFDEIKFVSP
eukprot:TRINITY_DN4730_c0_g1_i9.p1 TRINITY_DN4730_c0_g1~~TRINITY_DN4730_c0_g1_i9.p1  ORF type:complete len:413 (-),score=50.89 TRINITY_DN4730_c0_g1_i9:2292-3530(-)